MSVKDLTVVALIGALGWTVQIFLPPFGPATIWWVILFATLTLLLLQHMTPVEVLAIAIVYGIVGVFVSKSVIAWFNIIANPVCVISAWAMIKATWRGGPSVKRLVPFWSQWIGYGTGNVLFSWALYYFGFLPWGVFIWYTLGTTLISGCLQGIVGTIIFPPILKAYVRIAPEMKGKYGVFGV